jgi:undecaprenyl diphosphate synthase
LAAAVQRGDLAPDEIHEATVSEHLYTRGLPDPDILIRTSGELRLSNFLLWQLAYTELFFTPTLWPDFNRDEFIGILRAFQNRERRFGTVDPA